MSSAVVRAACLALIALVAPSGATPQPPTARLLITTDVGVIDIEVDQAHAPLTAANFLRYVEGGFFDGGQFHRSARLETQADRPVRIEVVQASISRPRSKEESPPIPLERTSVTGLRHKEGTVSMARSSPDSATSSFFICISDQPSLDFGGARNADGQGFAAFGRVVGGMDVVRKIHQAPARGETLTPPVRIVKIERTPHVDLVEAVRGDPDLFGVIDDVLFDRTHDPSLVELWEAADAVVHLRVEESLGALPWPLAGNRTSRVVSTEYRARVLEVLKTQALGRLPDPALLFLQTYAGVWRDSTGRSWRSRGWPEDTVVAGSEFVAFLRWDASVDRYCRTALLPVRGGRVFCNAVNKTVVRDGSSLDDVLSTLRAMRR